MEHNTTLACDVGELLDDLIAYRQLIRCLIYLTIFKPKLSHGVTMLSHFMHQPMKSHMDVAHHLLCYLKGTLGQGIFFYSKSILQLKAYYDFN